MKKEELRQNLLHGKTLSDCFEFTQGENCLIFKSATFENSEKIIYIPDVFLNELSKYVDNGISADSSEEANKIVDDILEVCYTGKDFIEECDGNVAMAEYLFCCCNWENPSTVHEDIIANLDEEKYIA
jgi:hypothetical protein